VRVESLLRSATQWAESDSRVVGLLLVGSHARGAARENSDVDLVLLSRAPQDLIRDRSWVGAFGAVASVSQEDYGRLTSVRVHYADGSEVEFGVTDTEWASLPLDSGTRHVLIGGARLLYDGTGHLGQALDSLQGT